MENIVTDHDFKEAVVDTVLMIDDARCADREVAGGKAAAIHFLRKSGIAANIPNGMVIPPDTVVSAKELDMRAMNTGKFAVRSSATVEDAVNFSFAGQFESVLNVSGTEEVLAAIERVRVSARSERALAYMQKNGLDVSQCRMAVLIMPMVGDERSMSGTIFTLDPESGLPQVNITANKGLGDREVAGIVTPESVVINEDGVTIRQKPRPGQPILLDRQNRMLLAQIARQIESFMRRLGICDYVDIEYVISEGKLWILQARPVTVCAGVRFQTVRPGTDKKPIVKDGVAAARGVATGRLVYCRDVRDAANMSHGDVMFCENTTSVWEPYMTKAGAILTKYGSANCHTAVVSREWKIPCMVGIGRVADNLLAYTGQPVTVDATACVVYEGLTDEADLIITSAVPAQYEGLDTVSLDEHFASASAAGQTFIDADGARYIGRPAEATGKALQIIHRMSHDFISREMGWRLVRHNVRDGRFEVLFEDIHHWRERLRSFTPCQISYSLREWDDTVSEYIHLSENISEENGREWLRLYIRLNAYMNLSFPLYAICVGHLNKTLADRLLPEPYLSRVYHSVRPGTPLSWAERMSDELCRLPADANENEMAGFAMSYRLQSRFSLEFDAVPQAEMARRFIESHRNKVFCPPLEEIFFPDDEAFCPVYDNYIAAKRLKESSHHIKFYGQYLANRILNEQRVLELLGGVS